MLSDGALDYSLRHHVPNSSLSLASVPSSLSLHRMNKVM